MGDDHTRTPASERGIRFYLDKDDCVRGHPEQFNKYIGFLTDDVQGSFYWSYGLFAMAMEVIYSDLPEWERTGNALTLIVRPKISTLEFNYDDEGPEEVPSAELLDAIEAWCDFVASEQRRKWFEESSANQKTNVWMILIAGILLGVVLGKVFDFLTLLILGP